MVQDVEVVLKRSTTPPFKMLDKVLMVMVEVYMGLRLALIPPIIQVILVDYQVLIVIVMTEVVIGLRPEIFLHITMVKKQFPPKFSSIRYSKGVCKEKISIKIILSILIQSFHHTLIQACNNILVTACHFILIQACHHTQMFLCPYYTSNSMYVTYVVPNYPHIPYLGYLHIKYSRLPSSMLPPRSSKVMSEHRRKRSGIISNYYNKKNRDVMSRREIENQDLVSVYVDGSHKD